MPRLVKRKEAPGTSDHIVTPEKTTGDPSHFISKTVAPTKRARLDKMGGNIDRHLIIDRKIKPYKPRRILPYCQPVDSTPKTGRLQVTEVEGFVELRAQEAKANDFLAPATDSVNPVVNRVDINNNGDNNMKPKSLPCLCGRLQAVYQNNDLTTSQRLTAYKELCALDGDVALEVFYVGLRRHEGEKFRGLQLMAADLYKYTTPLGKFAWAQIDPTEREMHMRWFEESNYYIGTEDFRTKKYFQELKRYAKELFQSLSIKGKPPLAYAEFILRLRKE